MECRVMTFNIQHGAVYPSYTGIDLTRVADVIRAQAPDVVVLNEVRGEGPAEDYTAQTETLAALLGWNGFFAKAFDVPDCGPYGNAILSPHPLTVSVFPIPAPTPDQQTDPSTGERTAVRPYYEPRAVFRAEVDFGEKKLAVFGTHFGLSPEEEENGVAAVCGMTDLESLPYVFMGDLNVQPHNPILDPLRERMQDTAVCFREPLCSYPSDCPDIKIDYIFASEQITVLSADIPAVVVSDHRPYTAQIRF